MKKHQGQSTGKTWLSLQSIAREYADLSERTLRAYLGHDKHPLPAHMVGGKWLVHRDDFDAWVHTFPRSSVDVDHIVDEVMAEMQCEMKETDPMPVRTEKRGDKFRIVEGPEGKSRIAKDRSGKAFDKGGFATKAAALKRVQGRNLGERRSTGKTDVPPAPKKTKRKAG